MKASNELAKTFPTNLYSFTKKLGEVQQENVLILRASFIPTHEFRLNDRQDLYSRIKLLPKNSSLSGATNYKWNGLTSQSLADIVGNIINLRKKETGIRHIHSARAYSRFEIIKLLCSHLQRLDININPIRLKVSRYMVLDSIYSPFHEALWKGLGFDSLPTFEELLMEESRANLN